MREKMDKLKVKTYRKISREMSRSMPKLSVVPNKKKILTNKYRDTETALEIEEYFKGGICQDCQTQMN